MSVVTFALLLLLLLLPSAVLSTSLAPFFQTYNLPNNTVGPAYVSVNFSDFSALTGISNGDVVKFNLLTKTFTTFASEPNRKGEFFESFRNAVLCDSNTNPNSFGICGRPFGIAYNSSGYVYFCDSNKGLYGVGPSGGQATQLVASAGGLPIFFCNAVDIDASGTVYFTDVSQKFRNTSLSVPSEDATGRLISYVSSTGKVTVLATRLYTPTGIAVSSDSSYILVSQLGNNSISKYYLTGPNAKTLQIFVSGFDVPANIRRSLDGNYYYVPQTPLPYIHYLVKIDTNGAVVGNVSIAGPYSAALFYRDARPIGPSTFLLGSQYTGFLGFVIIPILGF